MSYFYLRECEPQDLDHILTLERDSFAASAYDRDDFAYLMGRAKGGFTVAVGNGRLLGYIIAVGEGRTGIIQSIAVSTAFRRKGVGEALMKSAIDYLSLFERIWLLVDSNNSAAISLYHKLSFKETGRIIKGYYRNGDDAVEMVRIRNGSQDNKALGG